MKIEGESDSTIQNAYEGESKQVHNNQVNAVLLQDGWYAVIPGSFKLHKTPAKVPFVRFDLACNPGNQYPDDDTKTRTTIEIFPQGLHGVAYPTESHSSLPANAESTLADHGDKFKPEEFK